MRDSLKKHSRYAWRAMLGAALLAASANVSSDGTNISTAAPAVSPAAQTAQTTPGLQLVGQARLKVLLWSVYDSRLYTSTGSYEDGQRPLRLEIQYLMDIKSSALVERTLEEWTAMGRQHPRQENWLTQLSTIWPDINENDVLTLELAADNTASFRRNGELLGSIEDEDFGQQFVDIWLSTDCTRPALRATLLGTSG